MKKILVSVPILLICIHSVCLASDTTRNTPAFVKTFAQWTLTELVKGGRIDAICAIDAGTVVCGTRNPNAGKLFISNDYGRNWRLLAQVSTAPITCIAAANNKEWYVLTGDAEVFGTKDGGATWKLLKKLSTHKNREGYAMSYSIYVTYHGTILVTDTNSDGGHIYRSVNKGESWTDLGAISGDALYRFTKVGNGIIVNGWQGNVYKTIDDGLTWNKVGDLTSSDLFATDYLGSHRILQADKDGNIFRSTNLGYEWKKIGQLPDAADDFIDLGYGAVYYSTYTGKREIYISLNYGDDWFDVGPVPSGITGDWLDHGIRLDMRDSIIVLAGTSKGNIMRNAISRSWLYGQVYEYAKKTSGIPASLQKDISSAVKGAVVDYNELIDPEDICIQNGFAYLPCRDGNNVAIVDYRNPNKPVLAHSLRDPDILDAFSVGIKDHYLYVLSMTNCKVSVYNIKDPYKPVKTGSITVGGEGAWLESYHASYTRLRKIYIDGNYAYVSHSSESKIYILDIKDPARPVIVSSFHTGDGAFGLLAKGNVLYLAGFGPGSSVIAVNVTDKTKPVITSRIYDSVKLAGTCALGLKDNLLYVIAYNADKVLVADVSDPFQLKEVTYFSTPGMDGPGRIALKDNTAYVINSVNDSMIAIDISNDAQPAVRYFISDLLIKKTYGIAIDKNLLLLAGRDARSFVVIDLTLLER